MLRYHHNDHDVTMSGKPAKRDSAIDAENKTLTRWGRCGRLVGFEPRKKKSKVEPKSDWLKTEEDAGPEPKARKPIMETIGKFWWGPTAEEELELIAEEERIAALKKRKSPPPMARRHRSIESTRLRSRTAHIRTSADLPSQRARMLRSSPGAQIADRRPRVTSTQSSSALPYRASNAPILDHHRSSDSRSYSSSATAQTSRSAPRHYTSVDSRTYSSSATTLANTPPVHYRTSFDPKAQSYLATVPSNHRRIVSDPQTTIGLATSTPNSAHNRSQPRRPSPRLTRVHTDVIPQFSYPLHTLPPAALEHYPRSLTVRPGAPGLKLPSAHISTPKESCPAPPQFRYPRTAPKTEQRNIEEEVDQGRTKTRGEKRGERGEETKTYTRHGVNESNTKDTTTEDIPDLPVPADVLAAGTSARRRRLSPQPMSAQYIDASSPRSVERIPAALATYTHANSSNTFAANRSTVLRRRMSCCDVEARIVALAWSTDRCRLQLGVKDDWIEGGEMKFRQWKLRVAKLEIEIDRMVAGGLLDQFEELAGRLHILEDERKAFSSV